MQYKLCVLGLAIGLSLPSVARADKDDDDRKTTAITEWGPSSQYYWGNRFFGSGKASTFLMGDILGDKLTMAGRVKILEACTSSSDGGAKDAVIYAVCAPDIQAWDLEKLKAELKAEGASERATSEIVYHGEIVQKRLDEMRPKIEKATDKGIAGVLKMGDDFRAEWTAYASKNADAVAQNRALLEAVKTQNIDNPAFAGCWDKTYPAFSKLVKATKFPWDIGSGDYETVYLQQMFDSPEHNVTAANFAMCAYSIHKGGEGLVASVFFQPFKRIHLGPRTHAAASFVAEGLKGPRFSDRSLDFSAMAYRFNSDDQAGLEGIESRTMMMTPYHGVIGKLKADGDVTTITFKGDKVEECLQWADTNKVQSVNNGNVQYEKKCLKRGMVANEEGSVEVPTKFLAGVKPGNSTLVVSNIPVTVWNGKKFVAIFGVAGDIKQK